MLNINNKEFNKLKFKDIEYFLENIDSDETFFFEWKKDDVTNDKLAKEVCAFANTYGGYILLGVDDDKRISGCKNWTEMKIHNVMYNNITPTPVFDCRRLTDKNGLVVYVVRVDQGIAPPYMTNKGEIFERVSSSSEKVKSSYKLTELYNRSENQLSKIANKIENFDPLDNKLLPENLVAYIDIGFSVVTRNVGKMSRKFCEADMKTISEFLKAQKNYYSISLVGYSYYISIGRHQDLKTGEFIDSPISGLSNFIEIMADGSIRTRLMIYSNKDSRDANIISSLLFGTIFKEVYEMIFGNVLYKNFICAYKYERINVVKDFIPKITLSDSDPYKQVFETAFDNHINKYGNNLIVSSNRYPKNDFLLLDRQYFSDLKIKFSKNNLLKELFSNCFVMLGYIDNLKCE